MLSTRTILVLAAAGLLLPLVIIALRQSDGLLRHDAMDCTHVTSHLEALDYVARLPDSPALVLGDTMARNWPDHIKYLAGRPVLVRHIDNLNAAAVANCFGRMVAHYRPSTVILLLGDRDLDKLETELSQDIRQIGSAMSKLNTSMNMVVTGLLHTPARDNNRVDLLNSAVAVQANSLPDVGFVDPNTELLTRDGTPDPQRFWPDGNTMGQDSYGDLAAVIEGAMRGLTLVGNGV